MRRQIFRWQQLQAQQHQQQYQMEMAAAGNNGTGGGGTAGTIRDREADTAREFSPTSQLPGAAASGVFRDPLSDFPGSSGRGLLDSSSLGLLDRSERSPSFGASGTGVAPPPPRAATAPSRQAAPAAAREGRSIITSSSAAAVAATPNKGVGGGGTMVTGAPLQSGATYPAPGFGSPRRQQQWSPSQSFLAESGRRSRATASLRGVNVHLAHPSQQHCVVRPIAILDANTLEAATHPATAFGLHTMEFSFGLGAGRFSAAAAPAEGASASAPPAPVSANPVMRNSTASGAAAKTTGAVASGAGAASNSNKQHGGSAGSVVASTPSALGSSVRGRGGLFTARWLWIYAVYPVGGGVPAAGGGTGIAGDANGSGGGGHVLSAPERFQAWATTMTLMMGHIDRARPVEALMTLQDFILAHGDESFCYWRGGSEATSSSSLADAANIGEGGGSTLTAGVGTMAALAAAAAAMPAPPPRDPTIALWRLQLERLIAAGR
jgi:hypothetical protein